MNEFEKLQKENEKIRKRIDKNLLTRFSTNKCNDIKKDINLLINNEIEQEELCEQ